MAPASTLCLSSPWVLSSLATLLLIGAWKVLIPIWWRPLRIKKIMEAQGIKGPSYRLFLGNMPELQAMSAKARSTPMPQLSHNILPRVLPDYVQWSEKYGKPFIDWLGFLPRVTVSDLDDVKDILSNKFGHFQKPTGRPDTRDLLGNGLAILEGETWAQHRRIVSPAFFAEKLKAMTPTMAACVSLMLEKWQGQLDGDESRSKEIEVHREFIALTADVIAHTAFGSSYAEGKQVFELQLEQQILMARLGRSVYIPGTRFLPTATNRYRWRLKRRIESTLRHIIQARMDSSKAGRADLDANDLLGLMMAASRKELQGSQTNLSLGMQDIIDECKTFFFAGHETTSTLLTWVTMLLAIHTEWQERARAEVLAHCGVEVPTPESLNHLKIVGMVLNEALRLYTPAVALFRQATKDMKLKSLRVPKGTVLTVPILALHGDTEVWGADAHEFNPQRFADGVAKACKNPTAFLPFSIGPRNCVGQSFAMLEAKIVVAMILRRFSFRLSPAYTHAPTILLTLQPQHGMQIIIQNAS